MESGCTCSGLGMSAFLFKVTVGGVQTVRGFPEAPMPLLARIPLVGRIFFNHNVLVYGAFLLVRPSGSSCTAPRSA